MRSLLITYADGSLSLAYPCAQSRLGVFQLLCNQLVSLWGELDQQTYLLTDGNGFELIKAIASIVRFDSALRSLDLQALKQDHTLLESLFLYQVGTNEQGETTIKPSQLMELHIYKPMREKPVWTPGEPLTVDHLPFPTSGDRDADSMANLFHSCGIKEGWFLWNELDAETLDKIFGVSRELARPEEDRLGEHLRGMYKVQENNFKKVIYGDWSL